MITGFCSQCGALMESGDLCPLHPWAAIDPRSPPDFQPGTPSPAVTQRPSLTLVAPSVQANHPTQGVSVSAPLAVVPAAQAHPFEKLKAFINGIDTDGDGIPFYRDVDELKGAGRIAWRIVLWASKYLPDKTKVGGAADAVVGAVDRSGFRGDVDKL